MNPATIVIVTYNRLEKTKRCIESVLNNTTYPHFITVVDNGSTDGTVEYLMSLKGEFANFILLSNNLGVAKAHNIGWMLSDKNYYVNLDDDVVILRPEWLEALVGMSDNLQQYGAFGHIWFDDRKRKFVDGYYLSDNEDGMDYFCPCSLIPKRTFEKVGYWNIEFGLYGFEDFDYRIRMQMSGLRYCYTGDTNYIEHIGPNMDPSDAKELYDLKVNSRNYGENKRFEFIREYESGTRSLKVSVPM